MKSKLDTKRILFAIARYGAGAESYLRNEGYGEKTIIAASFREESSGFITYTRDTGSRVWQLSDKGWAKLREIYERR